MPDDSKWKFYEGEDLAENLESGIFYMSRAMKDMKNIFKTTGKTDKRLAKKEFQRILKAHLDRYQDGKRTPGKSPTIAEVIEEIEQTESPSLRAKTQSKRTFYFKRIRDSLELGHLPVDKLTLKLWTTRLDKERARRPRKTFIDYTKHANILLRYAYEQKYISHMIPLPRPDKKKQTGIVLTMDEIRLLWEVMGETLRDQFVLSYECCMRLREMLHLTWDRVDLETGEITLRADDVKTGSKTGKGRTFVATPAAHDRLRVRWAKACGQKDFPPTNWVFPSPTGTGPIEDNKTAWNNAKAKALKKNPAFQHWARWHDLRHTAITRMVVEQQMNIALVSEYVGTSVDTLQRTYLHSTAEKTKSVSLAISILGKK